MLRFFESNGTAYMVLEYVQGETLADRLSRERQLPEESLQRLLEEVLSGLSVMHDAGYVHRDIKPGNLMLREEDGSAVVLDFGAARQAVGQRSRAITSILTPGYAPVEQYDGKVDRVGAWTDIYALGMVAYRCISGIGDSELPDAVARMLAQSRGEAVLPPAVEAGKGKYSPKLLEAIDWAIEVDEGDRPQTVDAWRGALAGGGSGKGPGKAARKPATQQRTGITTRRTGPSWSTIGLTMAIIALLGLGAWWGTQEYSELFGLGPGNAPVVAEAEAPAAMAGENPQTAETVEGKQALSGAEETTSPEPTKPATEEEDEITRLLAAAEADFKARRLTRPAGNNAWDRYLRVLELEPANPDAIRGMERVIERYGELFASAVEGADFDKAAGYLSSIRDLNPDSPVLDQGEQRLKEARQARENRLAEQERQRQAALERQRIANTIKEQWTAFETAIQAEDLSEAANILNQVRALNSEEPGLPTGEQRLETLRTELERQQIAQVIEGHWDSFEAAMQAGDLDEAAGILAQVRDLNPEEPGLAAGEQRLATAQAIAERKRVESEARARKAVGEMVSIPGGTFRMGDLSGDGNDNERPVHSVTVSDFNLGKYEVTFAQWDACVADGGCRGYRPDDRGWGRGNRPVIDVSWNDAQAFISWLNDKTGGKFRLPTEAEWEYAARAGSTTKYSWGNKVGKDRANCAKRCGDQWEYTAPVGSFSANAWGLHDMHGNVLEWVQDCHYGSYVDAPTDGSAWESGECRHRVFRGGSWSGHPKRMSSSYRELIYRTDRSDLGFRLAQDK